MNYGSTINVDYGGKNNRRNPFNYVYFKFLSILSLHCIVQDRKQKRNNGSNLTEQTSQKFIFIFFENRWFFFWLIRGCIRVFNSKRSPFS